MPKPPKKPPKGKCPPGKHVWKTPAETTDGWVIHLCKKCPETIKRPRDKGTSGKARADGVGWGAG